MPTLSQIVCALAFVGLIKAIPVDSAGNFTVYENDPLAHQDGTQADGNLKLIGTPSGPIKYTDPVTGLRFEAYAREASSVSSNERLDCLSRARSKAASDISLLGTDTAVENDFWWYQHSRTRVEVNARRDPSDPMSFGEVYAVLDGVYGLFEHHPGWRWRALIDVFRKDGTVIAGVHLMTWEGFTEADRTLNGSETAAMIRRDSSPSMSKRDLRSDRAFAAPMSWTDSSTKWRYYLSDYNNQNMTREDRDELLIMAVATLTGNIHEGDADPPRTIPWVFRHNRDEIIIIDDLERLSSLQLRHIIEFLQSILNQFPEWNYAIKLAIHQTTKVKVADVLIRTYIIDGSDYQSADARNVTELSRREFPELQMKI